MTTDLISRSALKKALLERSFFPAIVKAALEKATAVDAVEVVRCRDCGYYRPKGKFCMGIPTEPPVFRSPNDFCSHGIRRLTNELRQD